MLHQKDWVLGAGVSIFFVTFILLNAIVLINVVVAVLLEKMVDNDPIPNDDFDEVESLSDEEHEHKEAPKGSSSSTDGERTKNLENDVLSIKGDLNDCKAKLEHIMQVMKQVFPSPPSGTAPELELEGEAYPRPPPPAPR